MKWECVNCGELDKNKVTVKYRGDLSRTVCNLCGPVVPRVIDLTKPMVVMQSVEVTDEMENDEIPF